jgi:hypothetical protein
VAALGAIIRGVSKPIDHPYVHYLLYEGIKITKMVDWYNDD